MKFTSKAISSVVFIIPLIFMWSGINMNRARYVNDPNYIYLMNALCICSGHSVGNIHNPGTTVMQVTAASIAGSHLLSNPENQPLVDHVIKEPERFIEATRVVFAFLNFIILALLGWIIYKNTKSIWLALLIQVITLISSNTLDYTWNKLSPEPLLFFTTGCFVLLCIIYYFEADKNRWKYVWLFSLAVGAGLATKATFLPFTIFPFIILPSIKQKLYYLLALIPAFILFTIPAIPEYKALFHWFSDMINHSGIYGQGEDQIIDTKTYLPNILLILKNYPIIKWIVGLGSFLLILTRLKKNYSWNWESRFLTGLILTSVSGILLVAKHYGANHYLIPILLLSGIELFFSLKLILQIFNSRILNKLLIPSVSIVFIVYTATVMPNRMKQIDMDNKIANEEINTANELIQKEYSDYTPINYYIFSLNKFTGLKFGDDFSKARIRADLKRIYPDTYFYEFSSDQFLKWNEKIELKDITKVHGNKIIVLNGPTDKNTLIEMEKRGFPLKQIYKSKSQNLFILNLNE